MAAPPTLTIKDLTGVYTMNKQLSDDFIPILELQEIAWLLRQAIKIATINITIKHYTAAVEGQQQPALASKDTPHDGLEHLDSAMGVSGITGTTELRFLDGVERANSDYIFGDYTGDTVWCTLDDVKEDFNRQGWLPETAQGQNVLRDHVRSLKRGWSVEQVWGFAEVNGQRYFVRRVVARSGSKMSSAKLVFDYSPLKQ